MGLGHSPSIPLTSLALFYDAANGKSYSGSGTGFTDLSGSGLTGTINNAPVFSYSAGGSFTFNGTSNTISFTRRRFTAGLTYAAWIKTTSAKNTATYTTTTANPIVGDTNNAVWNGFGVHNGKLRYCYYNRAGSAVITSDSTASVNTGSWIHVAVTHSYTETAKLYINGILDSTFNVATTGANDPWAQALAADRVGTGYSSSDFFNGSIAQVALYSVDLTADNILALYSASRERFNTPAVNLSGAVLNLDAGNTLSYSGSGTTWTDLSGNGNNGTLTNSPTYNSGNGGYLLFDGSNDYVNVPYAASLDTPLGCCYEVWMYPTTTTGAEFISRGTSDAGTYPDNPRLYCSSTGSIYFDWSRPGLDIYGDYLGATMNGWNQIVVNATPGDYMKLYINAAFKGNNQNGGVLPSPVPNNAYPIQIGGATWINRYFAGRIAVVRVYRRTLSPLEIARNFDALRGRFGL